jgi:hypothetical protein
MSNAAPLALIERKATMASSFITKENVEHFLRMLQTPDLETATAGTLQKLLADELSKLTRNREELGLAQQRVREGADQIKRLQGITDARRFDDEHRERSLMALLATMKTTQQLLVDFEHTFRIELEPYCVMLRSTAVAICGSFAEAKSRAQTFADANPTLVVMIVDRSNGDSHVVSSAQLC